MDPTISLGVLALVHSISAPVGQAKNKIGNNCWSDRSYDLWVKICTKFQVSYIRMAIWLIGLERWYLLLGGVVVGRGFEPQSDLELSIAQILM
jgi:hypothetical protein